jgi:hypothetical protein
VRQARVVGRACIARLFAAAGRTRRAGSRGRPRACLLAPWPQLRGPCRPPDPPACPKRPAWRSPTALASMASRRSAVMVVVRWRLAWSSLRMSRQISWTIASASAALRRTSARRHDSSLIDSRASARSREARPPPPLCLRTAARISESTRRTFLRRASTSPSSPVSDSSAAHGAARSAVLRRGGRQPGRRQGPAAAPEARCGSGSGGGSPVGKVLLTNCSTSKSSLSKGSSSAGAGSFCAPSPPPDTEGPSIVGPYLTGRALAEERPFNAIRSRRRCVRRVPATLNELDDPVMPKTMCNLETRRLAMAPLFWAGAQTAEKSYRRPRPRRYFVELHAVQAATSSPPAGRTPTATRPSALRRVLLVSSAALAALPRARNAIMSSVAAPSIAAAVQQPAQSDAGPSTSGAAPRIAGARVPCFGPKAPRSASSWTPC